MTTFRDNTGREIKAGDTIKVFHFVARPRGRIIFMYKLVCRVGDDRKIAKDGKHLFAVDVADIYAAGSLDAAHKCPLSMVADCEIIDGGSVENNDLFWERERRL